jgi:hypothetical protein
MSGDCVDQLLGGALNLWQALLKPLHGCLELFGLLKLVLEGGSGEVGAEEMISNEHRNAFSVS